MLHPQDAINSEAERNEPSDHLEFVHCHRLRVQVSSTEQYASFTVAPIMPLRKTWP